MAIYTDYILPIYRYISAYYWYIGGGTTNVHRRGFYMLRLCTSEEGVLSNVHKPNMTMENKYRTNIWEFRQLMVERGYGLFFSNF